jgi:hypothetical protein
MAAVAGAAPDWDGLSLLFGPEAYARVHRVWGHNLLMAGAGGLLIAVLEYRFAGMTRLFQALARRTPGLVLPKAALDVPRTSFTWLCCGVWMILGLAAAGSHLLADFFYSGHPRMRTWGLPLLWPFSDTTWALPVVQWGDLGATIIFVVEMFALYRWVGRPRLVASITLTAIVAYVWARWMLRNA